MPFEFPTVPALNPDATPKYDLSTGKGRLMYLADQLAARKPVGFNMGSWSTCAIGEATGMPELVKRGIRTVPRDSTALGAFFGIHPMVACHLFGGASRTVEEEVAVLRTAACDVT